MGTSKNLGKNGLIGADRNPPCTPSKASKTGEARALWQIQDSRRTHASGALSPNNPFDPPEQKPRGPERKKVETESDIYRVKHTQRALRQSFYMLQRITQALFCMHSKRQKQKEYQKYEEFPFQIPHRSFGSGYPPTRGMAVPTSDRAS